MEQHLDTTTTTTNNNNNNNNMYLNCIYSVLKCTCFHMYADDGQLYVDFSPCDEKTALANLQRCIQEVREWLRENFLLLNDKKN